MSECNICLQKKKYEKKIECNHSFCYQCIKGWSDYSNKCPLCRHKYLLNNHNYNTRLQKYINNKDDYIIFLKEKILNFWIEDTIDEQIKIMNDILKFIYNHKMILKNKNFKDVVLEKIEYLKNENIYMGYYWDQKIYSFK